MAFNKKNICFVLALCIAVQPIMVHASQSPRSYFPSFPSSSFSLESIKNVFNSDNFKKYVGMLVAAAGFYGLYRWIMQKPVKDDKPADLNVNQPPAQQQPPQVGTSVQRVARAVTQQPEQQQGPSATEQPIVPLISKIKQPLGVLPEQQSVQVMQDNPPTPVTPEPMPPFQEEKKTIKQPMPQSRTKKPLTPSSQAPESIKSYVIKWIPKNYENMGGAFLDKDEYVVDQYNFREKNEIDETETKKIFEDLVTELKGLRSNSNIEPEEVFDDIKNGISAFKFGGSIDSCRSKVFALLEEVVMEKWDLGLGTDIQPTQQLEERESFSLTQPKEPKQISQVPLESQSVTQIAPTSAPTISPPLQKSELSTAEKKLVEEPIFIEKKKNYLDDWYMSDYLTERQNDKSSLFAAGEGSLSVIVKVISELNIDILNPNKKIYKESDLLSLLTRAENEFHHYLLKPEKGYKSLTTKFTESDAQILTSLDWVRPGAMIEYAPQSPSKLEKYYEDEFGLKRWNGNITKNKENFSRVHYWIAKAMHLKTFGFPAASAREACAYFNLWRENTKAFANDPAFHTATDVMCNKALLEK